MKSVVRRNQIIITSLAILIAVAGYLNYTERNVAKQTANKVEKESIDDSTTSNMGGTLNEVSADASKEFESDSLLSGTDDIPSNDENIDGDTANANGDVSNESGDIITKVNRAMQYLQVQGHFQLMQSLTENS